MSERKKHELNQEQMLLQMQCVAIDLLNGHQPTEPLNLKIRDILLSFSRDAVAGAYAAAAKHPVHFMFDVAMGCYSSATCGCGKEFDTENTCAEWAEHILALTPADARPAQQQLGSEYLIYVPGHFRCTECGFQLSKQTLSAQTGNIGITENNLVTEPCPNDGTMMVKVTWKEAAENASERLTEVFNERDEARAAIASAEARARQFQELADIVRTSHERSIYHANGGRCRVCELLNEIPDTRGEAAARTPDSTGGQS